MGTLDGHEAGNGGDSQGEPTGTAPVFDPTRRGASGDVAHGGTRTPPRNRKGESGNAPPTGARAWDLSRHPHARIRGGTGRQRPVLPDQALVTELGPVVAAVAAYRQAVEDFFAVLPAASWMRTLPIGEQGITAPTLWARRGDAPGRWESFQHLQAHAGAVPVTVKSGKQQIVHFRFACDKMLRHVVDQVAFLSLRSSEWAGRTTTRSGRGATRIARRSGHWARSG